MIKTENLCKASCIFPEIGKSYKGREGNRSFKGTLHSEDSRVL